MLLFKCSTKRAVVILSMLSILLASCVNTNMYDGPERKNREIAIVITTTSVFAMEDEQIRNEMAEQYHSSTEILSVFDKQTNELRKITGMNATGKVHLVKCLPGSYTINAQSYVATVGIPILGGSMGIRGEAERSIDVELEAGYLYSITLHITSLDEGEGLFELSNYTGHLVVENMGRIKKNKALLKQYK